MPKSSSPYFDGICDQCWIVTGRVIFVFNFGSGPGMLISQTSLTSGEDLHSVTFGFNGTQGFLQVNKEIEQTTQSLGLHNNLNSNSALYVGGTDLQASSLPSEVPFSQQFVGMLCDYQCNAV